MAEVLDRHAGERVAAEDEQAVLVGQHVEELARLVADRRPRQGSPRFDRPPELARGQVDQEQLAPRGRLDDLVAEDQRRVGDRLAERLPPEQGAGPGVEPDQLVGPGVEGEHGRSRPGSAGAGTATRGPTGTCQSGAPGRAVEAEGEPVGQRVDERRRVGRPAAGPAAADRRTRLVGGPERLGRGSVSAGRREGSTVTARRIRSLARGHPRDQVAVVGEVGVLARPGRRARRRRRPTSPP